MAKQTGESGIKTPEQVEFAKLFEQLKLSNAEVARELHYSNRSAITNILDGTSGISKGRLEMMRQLVARHKGAQEHVSTIESRLGNDNVLRDQMEYLRKHAPAQHDSARMVVDSIYQSVVNLQPKAVDVSPEQAKAYAASGAAKKLAQELPPTQSKPGPIGRKRRRGGGAPPGKK